MLLAPVPVRTILPNLGLPSDRKETDAKNDLANYFVKLKQSLLIDCLI
jgi:hypothetical protein